MKTQSNDLIESIAVDVTDLLLRKAWNVHIVSQSLNNTTETKKVYTEKSMDGTIADIANFNINVENLIGGQAKSKTTMTADTSDKSKSKVVEEETLKSYRLQWRMSYSSINGYPVQSQHEILFLDDVVIKFFGKIQFDIFNREILFVLDELTVLGVQIDIDKISSRSSSGS